jgi:mono/diheme cytochrome c family protein
MRLIGRFLKLLAAALIGVVVAVALMLFLVMPRMQWNATARPSATEKWVIRYVLGRWVRSNASSEANPIPETPENLAEGEHEYNEHCAVCHGLDGNAENHVEGEFYPPIPRLAKGAAFLSDGQLYFILGNGIRMTAMPGFATRHSSDELWKIILWVRHFPNLTAEERATIQARIKEQDGGEQRR